MPPALANLLPLLVIIAVYFLIGKPLTKRWQASLERQMTPQMREQYRQRWVKMRAGGRTRYIWRYGVLRFGGGCFAIGTPLLLLFAPRTHSLTVSEILASTLISAIIWPIGGYWFGRQTWDLMEKMHAK
jgi:uncharacterized BrkB/YihY/UPF0761 family membrane protein